MDKDNLQKIAKQMVDPKKGIFASDWSLHSSEKHFAKNNIEHTEENRRKYRQMLYSTPGLEEYISGVILFEEALTQKTDDGKTFPQLLESKGILPGIKVDRGMKDMANFPGDKVTAGLDGLRERLNEYVGMGAKFTKWRAAYAVDDMLPTSQCMESNAEVLARYAAMSQEAGLVPIVEPEVLMDGNHTLERCEEVSKNVLSAVFSALEKHKIFYEGMILKTNFVHPGKDSDEEVDYKMVAEETLLTFERVLPTELTGVVFLSGGISSQESTALLDLINKKKRDDKQDLPWEISFSYARALQYPAIEIWAGKDENIETAQKALLKRAHLNSLARQGKYESSMEEE